MHVIIEDESAESLLSLRIDEGNAKLESGVEVAGDKD